MMPDRGPQVDLSELEEELPNEEPQAPSKPSAGHSISSPTPSPIPEEEKKKYFKSYG
jgi:hypothetical protein